MNNWLNRPFPLIEKLSDKLLLSFLFGVAVFLFLLIYQPFDIDEILRYKLLILVGLFFITFIVMAVNLLLLPSLLPRLFQAESWTTGKNLLLIIWITLTISVFNWIYNVAFHYYCIDCFSSENAEAYSLPYFVFITLSVGIFPITLYMLLAERFLSQQHHKIASQVTEQLHSQVSSESVTASIQINSENQKEENLDIALDNLVCISAEGNYINVYYKNNEQILKKLLRNSLSNIEQQLTKFKQISRCHRSYIVNLEQVQEVKGNARNYSLQIPVLDFEVPVSRNFPREVIENLQKNA